MKLNINKCSILSQSINKSFSEKFNRKINIIIGGKDSGKTSLARSIMYTLGCDVRNFDLIKKYPDIVFILEFSIDNQEYIIIRQQLNEKGVGKNCFKLFCINSDTKEIFFNTTEFSKRLNELLEIKLITLNKSDERSYLFPNHIFLPFYMDQDFSWQSYLTSTFSSVKFIKNYKKLILEYFTGMRGNEYYELLLQKNEAKKEFRKLDALVESKEIIFEENSRNIKIIEDIDIQSFKEKYKLVLKVYENVIQTEHDLKKEYNEHIYEKNLLEKQYDNLSTSIEKIIPQELEEDCPNCKQIIYKEMSENYQLLLSKENLIKERQKIQLYLKKSEENIQKNEEKLIRVTNDGSVLRKKLDADKEVVSLADRAESYAFSNINSMLSKEIKELTLKREEKRKLYSKIEAQLNELNKNDVSKSYQSLMLAAYKELDIPFSYNNYYTNNLESVKIDLSGASKVQAFLAQYLSVYELTNNRDGVKFPFVIDTFLKDDLNHAEINRTTDFLLSKLDKSHQSFLFISDNKDTLARVDESEVDCNKLHLGKDLQLFDKDYSFIYSEYNDYLEAEFI